MRLFESGSDSEVDGLGQDVRECDWRLFVCKARRKRFRAALSSESDRLGVNGDAGVGKEMDEKHGVAGGADRAALSAEDEVQ